MRACLLPSPELALRTFTSKLWTPWPARGLVSFCPTCYRLPTSPSISSPPSAIGHTSPPELAICRGRGSLAGVYRVSLLVGEASCPSAPRVDQQRPLLRTR